MIRPRVALVFTLSACAAAPDQTTVEPAVAAERAQEQEARKGEEQRRDLQAVLVRLDQMLDSYVQALSNHGELRADQARERLERSIRDTVLDEVPKTRKQPGPPSGENFRRLQALAADGTTKHQQGIALAALGFSGQESMMPVILQGAQSNDPFLVDRAVLGLAVLKSPATPPGVLAAIAERPNHPEDGRVQAAWALYEIQGKSERQDEIVAIWRRFLGELRDTMPPGILVTAVRGLGFARDGANADLVAPLLKHPTPRLRMAAAVAIARMNAQQFAPDLLDLLGPQETVQNVRLYARKALADLAGGQDYGYDVAAWRKVFDRGR